jgi:hypothetical protein
MTAHAYLDLMSELGATSSHSRPRGLAGQADGIITDGFAGDY